MALSAFQAARLLARFDKERDTATLKGMQRGLTTAQKLCVTQFMQGLGSGKTASPPNPAPGPIGIRKGNLRRSVRVLTPTKTSGGFTGGLTAGGPKAPYARIQEEGGTTKPHVILPVKKKALMFRSGNSTVFATKVNHPGSKIPARPYMRPALEASVPSILAEVERANNELVNQLFR